MAEKSWARRPDVFDQGAFEEDLRRQRCLESFVSTVTSDYRLIVPVALAHLGVDGIVAALNEAREGLGLNEQEDLWRVSAEYAVGWAEEALRTYGAAKHARD